MSTEARPAARRGTRDRWFEIRDADWPIYAALVRRRGDRPVPRMIYLDGGLLLVSPSDTHEERKKRLGTFVGEVVAGLRIPCLPKGQTTFRRRSRRGGFEGDEAYYLANLARVRGKKTTDLEVDPPPDLVIEVVQTHPVTKALATYGRLGVPEVWVSKGEGLRILALGPDGRYAERPTSLAFPFLEAAEIAGWVAREDFDDETEWMLAVRHWVATTLADRVRPPGGEV